MIVVSSPASINFAKEQIVYNRVTFPLLFKCGSLKWVGLDLYVAYYFFYYFEVLVFYW